MRWVDALGALALGLSWVAPAVSAPAATPTNEQCLQCHSERSPKGENAGQPIDMKLYGASAHAETTCAECHPDAEADTHEGGLARAVCSSCHSKQVKQFAGSAHATAKDKVSCADCHGTHDTLAVKNAKSRVFRINLPDTCARCHDAKKRKAIDGKGSQLFDVRDYKKSIHFTGMTDDGLAVSATCTSCHENHAMRSAKDAQSSVARDNVPKTCGSCHDGMFQDYMEGAHGQALTKGNSDTPICTDCHGEHGILDNSDPASSVFATNISKSTCPQCHDAEHVNRRYGLATSQRDSYGESFHGLADKFGDATVANCASCHGAHKILHSSNPKSSVNAANLPETCGKCHPGAGDNFAKGSVHRPEKAEGGAILHYVRWIYMFLIGATIGGMLLYNGLDYLATMRERWRERRRQPRVQRFTAGERIQHVLLVVTFFVMVFTGFALRYPDAFWVKPLIDTQLSFLVRGYAHRVAASIFIAVSVYHVYYLIWTARGRGQLKAILPTREDAKELWHQLRYYVGLEARPAHFGRYSYVEKVEYLALIWGSIVMVVTGLILWFEVAALRLLPKWGWDLAELVHLYEAWLATLSILVWHLYHVAFKPAGHGVSLAMATGDLTLEEMHHEHPRELETLRAEDMTPPESEQEQSHDTATVPPSLVPAQR